MSESHYWMVEMGPIPNMPEWHMKMYEFQSYAFPSEQAAKRFASNARERDWDRDIAIRYPDGTIYRVPPL